MNTDVRQRPDEVDAIIVALSTMKPSDLEAVKSSESTPRNRAIAGLVVRALDMWGYKIVKA